MRNFGMGRASSQAPIMRHLPTARKPRWRTHLINTGSLPIVNSGHLTVSELHGDFAPGIWHCIMQPEGMPP